jgi:hypothetical protein
MSPVIEVRQLPDVTHVIYRGDVVVVTGNSNALNAVTSTPAAFGWPQPDPSAGSKFQCGGRR